MSSLKGVEIGGLDRTYIADKASSMAAYGVLPEVGRDWAEIRMELIARKREDYNWRGGRIPIYVYHDTDELLAVSREAYNIYFSENALGRRAFPSVAIMEEELVRWSLALFRAPTGAGGTFTSGGTESIFLAIKAARDYYRKRHPGVSSLRIVIPRTAHPAFDKAAQYLDLKVVRTEIGPDLRANLGALVDAIDEQTILLAASAPCYPYGVFDPIDRIAQIASERKIWLHIDACLGGFLAPFAREEGYAIPDFDFTLAGVTSLSADLHKFGFAARGASVILYRTTELHSYQRFDFDNWPRGTYSTETFLGSRAAGAVASAWAVSQYLGRKGYCRLARKIMSTKERLIRGIEIIPGLEVIRPTELNILLYRSSDRSVDLNAVAEGLTRKGWFVGRTSEPLAVHFALNPVHAPVIDEYLADLGAAVADARVSGPVGEGGRITY